MRGEQFLTKSSLHGKWCKGFGVNKVFSGCGFFLKGLLSRNVDELLYLTICKIIIYCQFGDAGIRFFLRNFLLSTSIIFYQAFHKTRRRQGASLWIRLQVQY